MKEVTGNITYKLIHGKRYPYYQWTENGKQKGRLVKGDELLALHEAIRIRDLKKRHRKFDYLIHDSSFECIVRRGVDFQTYAAPSAPLLKRDCFAELYQYLHAPYTNKVLVLYGLRRTGKTTLMRQGFLSLSEQEKDNAAFLQASASLSLRDLAHDVGQLVDQGCRFLFIDEITFLPDFIDGAAMLADIYAESGIKIVLSGTDSLGFALAQKSSLYDRCIAIHTTYIPYREFETVLGIHGVDDYIRYGGTMSLSGAHYNEDVESSIFASKDNADQYINASIVNNIQHSVIRYGGSGRYALLYDAALAGQLGGDINRIIADMNHAFTAEVLAKEFVSSDLSLSAKNLIRDKVDPTPALYDVDVAEVTKRLAEALQIRREAIALSSIPEGYVDEIHDYLVELDLLSEVKVVFYNDPGHPRSRNVFTQPGMRYAQCEALLDSLYQDGYFASLPLKQRKRIGERIEEDIMGRMMEDAILLAVSKAYPKCKVFKLVFPLGEFDMAVFDPAAGNCRIYELNHATTAHSNQAKHLLDDDLCQKTALRYGDIVEKTVLYRGKSKEKDGIKYQNIEEFLVNLPH